MIFKALKTGQIATNCYILGCQESLEALVVDPGDNSNDIITIIEEENLLVKYIINTHGHVDHIGANEEIKRSTGAKVLVHAADADFLINPDKNLSCYMGKMITGPAADQLLYDGDIINVGFTIQLKVLHTPGHTPGGICLLGDKYILTGDTLFAGSIGRSDFPGGSQDILIDSIKKKLLNLNEDLIIYPGHGPSSTLKKEKECNTFLS